MTRNGKIAWLPHPIREQINRRLQPPAEATKDPGELAVSKDTLAHVTDGVPSALIKVNQGGSS